MSSLYAHKRRWSWPTGLALVLWLVGFELIPTLHVAFHDTLGEHEHGVSHEQEGHAEARSHRHADHGAHEDGDREPDTPSEHGKGSLAHFDIAVNVPLPGVPTVREALLAWSDPPVREHDERPADLRPRTSRARAPPEQWT